METSGPTREIIATANKEVEAEKEETHSENRKREGTYFVI